MYRGRRGLVAIYTHRSVQNRLVGSVHTAPRAPTGPGAPVSAARSPAENGGGRVKRPRNGCIFRSSVRAQEIRRVNLSGEPVHVLTCRLRTNRSWRCWRGPRRHHWRHAQIGRRESIRVERPALRVSAVVARHGRERATADHTCHDCAGSRL